MHIRKKKDGSYEANLLRISYAPPQGDDLATDPTMRLPWGPSVIEYNAVVAPNGIVTTIESATKAYTGYEAAIAGAAAFLPAVYVGGYAAGSWLGFAFGEHTIDGDIPATRVGGKWGKRLVKFGGLALVLWLAYSDNKSSDAQAASQSVNVATALANWDQTLVYLVEGASFYEGKPTPIVSLYLDNYATAVFAALTTAGKN